MSNVQVKMPRIDYEIAFRDAAGTLQWVEKFSNLVTDEGITYLLQQAFKGVDYTAAWYVGLLNNGAVLATSDTAALHAGWTEFTGYDETGRPVLDLGAMGVKTVNNSLSKAVFTVNADGVVAGSFLSTSSAKGLTSGVIYSEALFASGNKAVTSGGTLAVTCNISGV